jgi:hypothetical protein
MNNEVTRLRQLRKTALKVRALASSLNASDSKGSAYARAAVLQWRIARIATGRLRSHPYKNYQKDPGLLESVADRVNGHVIATLANMRGQGMSTFLAELKAASRELADARALTLSTDLSEALGRSQMAMKALIDEIRCQLPMECTQQAEAHGEHAASGMQSSRLTASPYLAL